nr:GGDEF domain-containing phosphodiesterase [Desulfurispira natronophila]
MYATSLQWEGRKALQLVAIDISVPRKKEQRLQLYESAFANTGEAIIITDSHGRIKEINPAFAAMSGYTLQEAVGENMRLLKSGYHDATFYRQMWQAVLDYGQWRGEVWNRRKSGEIFPAWLSVARIFDDDMDTIHYVGILNDLSEIDTTRKELEYKDSFDQLTGLPNKDHFMQLLDQAIKRCNFSAEYLSLLTVTIDNHRDICDRGGTETGDLFLQSVASRLHRYFVAPAIMARIRTNTFAILLPLAENHWDIKSAVGIIFRNTAHELNLDGCQYHSTVSIGIATYPNHASSPQLLLRNSLMAMHRAQAEGDSAYLHYSHQMQQEVLRDAQLGSALKGAIGRGEMEVHYQPKVSLLSGKVTGVEALLRWQREGQMISPADFIPLAEKSGDILPIGEWVLRTACKQLRRWHDEGHDHLGVAVNLSGKQFRDTQLVDLVKDALQESGIPPQCLNLEITENMLIERVEEAIETMKRITELGVQMSIDDFGRGYSSLTYLKRFPINVLKVDQSFVKDLPTGQKDVAIASNIISLGKSLNLKVIAEGVETGDQLEFIRSRNCHEMQGFLFSKAITPEKISAMLRSGKHL